MELKFDETLLQRSKSHTYELCVISTDLCNLFSKTLGIGEAIHPRSVIDSL